MEHLASNDEVRSALTLLVADRIVGADPATVRPTPISINDWSFVFRVDPRSAGDAPGYYVKIPKAEVGRTSILPRTAGSERLAHDEYASLMHLRTHWRADDLAVAFVKPVAFFEEHCAIVTEGVEAEPFFTVLRRRDLVHRASAGGRTKADAAHRALRRLGVALARYHRQSARLAAWQGAELAGRLRSQGERLARHGWPREFAARLSPALDGLGRRSGEGEMTSTLKGLDVRNVLRGDADRLILLDPGKIKTDFGEADVARFLMTCRIVHWGSPLFALGLKPHRSFEAAFLAGYYDGGRPPALLAPMMLKEALKTWLMAYTALQAKPWPEPLKALVRRYYIDRVLGHWIDDDLSNLKAH